MKKRLPSRLAPRDLSLTVIFLLSAALSACGFQMRDTMGLKIPYNRIKLISYKVNELEEANRKLRDRSRFASQTFEYEVESQLLMQPGMELVEKITDAQIVLYILEQKTERQVLAFSSAGRPREIQIEMFVRLRITDHLGVELLSPQWISQTRELTVNEAEVLSMTAGETTLRDDMQRELAYQILRRLRAVKLPQ